MLLDKDKLAAATVREESQKSSASVLKPWTFIQHAEELRAAVDDVNEVDE